MWWWLFVCLVAGLAASEPVLAVENGPLAQVLKPSPGNAGSAGAQPAPPPDNPQPMVRMFLDCRGGCDGAYIRTELNFVDHVTDRKAADVHVLITTRGTGGGGTQYTISFIGLGRFEAIQDSATYTTRQGDSDDDVRRGLVRSLKLGIVRYVALTPLRDSMDVNFKPPREWDRQPAQGTKDPWNSWVFRLRGSIDTSGEVSNTSIRLWNNASASRVTEAWKAGFSLNMNYRRNRYSFEDEDDYISISRDSNVSALLVKTVGSHWGAGARVWTSSSTYVNQARTVGVAPAIEFNVFPYAETTRRQLTFRYSMSLHRFRYHEITIYDRTTETMAGQSLVVNLDMRQPWGQLGVQAVASQYVPDFEKNRLSLDSGVEVRLFKGFSLNLGADTSLIRDQIYLPAADATEEDILLRQRQVATSYDYRFSVGFTYSFGSVYNNVVNSRLNGF